LSDPADQTTVVPPAAPEPTGTAPLRAELPRPPEPAPRSRQARVVVRKLGPWSILKISFLFYLCVMVVIVGAMMILYGILGAIGALDSLTRLIRDLFADQSFKIDGGWLFSRGIAIGLGMVVLWTLINVFVVFLYNLLSDVVGGIEVTLSERR
jgi:Transmembrane domain of unknown function (DUF3566)